MKSYLWCGGKKGPQGFGPPQGTSLLPGVAPACICSQLHSHKGGEGAHSYTDAFSPSVLSSFIRLAYRGGVGSEEVTVPVS